MDIKAQIRRRFPEFEEGKVNELARLLGPPLEECVGGCRKKKAPVCAGKGRCKGAARGFKCAGHVDVSCPEKCGESDRKSWSWS